MGCIGVTWRGLGALCWVGVVVSRRVARSCAPCHGGWWWLGFACSVEVAWQVGGVLRVVLRQHGESAVVGCCVPYWGGVVWQGVASHVRARAGAGTSGDDLRAHARGSGNVQRSGPKPSSSFATSSILRNCGIVSHVGAACWGGDEWRWLTWLTCTRGQQWSATVKLWYCEPCWGGMLGRHVGAGTSGGGSGGLHAQGDGNGLQC
ncbi:hypothetical protein EDB85DRAFT_1888118 [Lactarius pseudohatsudake]|nr:hypothetical protein EDB85DRAFT_1888118 [Lactarius pseudohatsudake]